MAAIAAAVLALPTTAAADSKPVVERLSIGGAAVVGATVSASAETSGEPVPAVTYQWLQCEPAQPAKCEEISGATGASYAISAAEAGRRLAVRARAVNTAGHHQDRSKLTAVVTAPPTTTPAPVPTPDPAPEPDPDEPFDPEDDQSDRFDDFGSSTSSPDTGPPAPSSDTMPRFLRPFPVVRIKGSLVPGGARISLLRVKAPSWATVVVRCEGRGCGLRRRSVGNGRIARLEHFLRAGIRITIRVTAGDSLGKYVRLVIRDGRAPKRRDACLVPGSSKPAQCPQA